MDVGPVVIRALPGLSDGLAAVGREKLKMDSVGGRGHGLREEGRRDWVARPKRIVKELLILVAISNKPPPELRKVLIDLAMTSRFRLRVGWN